MLYVDTKTLPMCEQWGSVHMSRPTTTWVKDECVWIEVSTSIDEKYERIVEDCEFCGDKVNLCRRCLRKVKDFAEVPKKRWMKKTKDAEAQTDETAVHADKTEKNDARMQTDKTEKKTETKAVLFRKFRESHLCTVAGLCGR